MTYQEIMEMAEEPGLPVAYDHFAEGEPQDPPYLVFLLPRRDDFVADGCNYFPIAELVFELYSDRKDLGLERRVEAVFSRRGLVFDKSEVWIGEEHLYEVLYEMEIEYEQE